MGEEREKGEGGREEEGVDIRKNGGKEKRERGVGKEKGEREGQREKEDGGRRGGR